MTTHTPDGVEWTPYAGPGRLFIGDQRVTDTATVDGVDYARTADGATFTRTGRGTDYEPADVPAPVTYSVRLALLTDAERDALRRLVHTGHLAGCDPDRYPDAAPGHAAAVLVGTPCEVLARFDAAVIGREVTRSQLLAHNAIRRRLWAAIDGDDAQRAAGDARTLSRATGSRGCTAGIDRGDVVTYAAVGVTLTADAGAR